MFGESMRILHQTFTLKLVLILGFVMLNFISQVQANLLVAPTMITFDGRERSEKLSLINTSDKTLTYRLEWSEKTALPNGGYRVLTDEKEMQQFKSASPMIRFTPRQVTLRAGERQVVAFSLRRPKNMLDGEYRSHLNIRALPAEVKSDAESEPGIKLNMIFNFSLPVIVRQGKPIPNIKIEGTEIVRNLTKNQNEIFVTFSRSGLYGASGDIKAYWKNNGSNAEKEVALINRYNIFHELDITKASLFWIGETERFSQPGSLRIVYQGAGKNRNTKLAEKTFNISPNMIQTKSN
jgi:P pilus assembly chaperone PapD